MRKDTPSEIVQEETAHEALFVIREAESLGQITLAGCDIEVSEGETGPAAPESGDEEKDHALNMEVCVAHVRRAALAVEEEARRLQSEVERYAARLLAEPPRDIHETAPLAEEDLLLVGDGDNVVLEALAIVGEAQRLQELMQRLRTRVAEAAQDGTADDD